MRRTCPTIAILLIALVPFICAHALAATGDPPAARPVNQFVLGVYWAWERTEGIAAGAGLDKWAFVERTCKMLGESAVNSVWLVNISVPDLKRLLGMSIPAGLQLLPTLGEIAPQNCRGTMGFGPDADDFHARALAYYKSTVPRIVREIGDDRQGILAWIMCDEPRGPYLDLMEPLRPILAEADTERPAMAVSMWGTTPDIIDKTRITTFCMDLYPFFAEGNPNGPHTPVASRGYYTVNIQRMVEKAGADGRVGWVMGQCYNEIWGPWQMQEDGVSVALPGSFVNWRSPSPAEMRWQIWEPLRLGAKGTVFFILLGNAGGKPSATALEPTKMTPNIVTEKRAIGFEALLDFRGRPTPQFREMARLYIAFARHARLLRDLTPTSTHWLAAAAGDDVANFTAGTSDDVYAVTVNRDFTQARKIVLTAAMGVREVRDMLTGDTIPLTPLGWSGGNSSLTVDLPAGGGTLLKVVR